MSILLTIHEVNAQSKPLRVFILAGQSNMEGHAKIETFDYLGDDPASVPLLGQMRDADGKPVVCDGAWISFLTGDEDSNVRLSGKLTAGYGSVWGQPPGKLGEKIGPEFTFGLTMDAAFSERVLIIKTAWGGRSLHTDFRSPSAGPYQLSKFQVENYPKQEGHGIPKDFEQWKIEKAKATGVFYRLMIEHVREVLADPKQVIPDYDASQGYEIAGFIWLQGFNDMVDHHVYPEHNSPDRFKLYSDLLTHFIRDVRKDLDAPAMPFVIGVMGVGGLGDNSVDMLAFRSAMAAPAALPEFQGNVKAVETAPFWSDELGAIDEKRAKISQMRYFLDSKHKDHANADGHMSQDQKNEFLRKYEAELISPAEVALWKRGASNAGYHYLGCAKTFALMGKAFADTNLQMLASATPDEKGPKIPDFTKGDVIPPEAKHDWNLGPTGLRGWMFCDKLVTTDARQIAITVVDAGSPADGMMAVGDVILGAGGKPFSSDPRTEFGCAVTAAETDQGGGRLVLTRWRAGKTENVTLMLPVPGSYSATAPYDCPKSKRILQQGLKTLSERVSEADYADRTDPIPRCLNALALLAGGDPSHLAIIRQEARWAADFRTSDFRTWYYGYVMIFLAEYVVATDDVSVIPGLRRLALEAAKGQSAVGSWGHTFALPDGRLRGYGMMNSPGLPLTIGLVLARDAGIKDPEIAHAVELSSKLLRFYTGKGAVPYGDHAPWTETHEDNGKCGMAAVLFNSLGESRSADYFTHMAVASHGSERDCGHTGNFFNLLWSLPAIGQAGPQATGAWMQEFGSWYHDLARRPDGTFAHQGPPEPDHDSYHGWDATGAYLLGYALPLRKIRLTGKMPGVVQSMSPETAQKIVADGRGWDNKDRRSFYDQLTDTELVERLGSWSPIVRERAAMAISWRKEPPLSDVIALLDSESLDARIGACHALEQLRGNAAPSVPQLLRTLRHEDLWLRVRAASALAAIGKPAVSTLPDLLDLIARTPSPDDPRGMEQRFVAFAVFGRLLPRLQSLDDVDRDQLLSAIAQGLQNQDGRARSEISDVYRRLGYQQIRPLLPAILEGIKTPAPSGEMFADGVRLNGLKVLASHHIEEGMQAAADYLRTQNPWASEHRTPEILEVFEPYGAEARVIVAHLEETAAIFDQGDDNFPRELSRQKAMAVREAIRKINSAKEHPELRSLK